MIVSIWGCNLIEFRWIKFNLMATRTHGQNRISHLYIFIYTIFSLKIHKKLAIFKIFRPVSTGFAKTFEKNFPAFRHDVTILTTTIRPNFFLLNVKLVATIATPLVSVNLTHASGSKSLPWTYASMSLSSFTPFIFLFFSILHFCTL